MSETIDQFNALEITGNSDQESSHPAWDELIVCRVEVDLPTWVSKLAGGGKWEVYSEDEDDHCISFAMRERALQNSKIDLIKPKLAEVTLYHNGHAIVDVEGQSLFEGSLTNGQSDCANLTYYHADSGEKITLN